MHPCRHPRHHAGRVGGQRHAHAGGVGTGVGRRQHGDRDRIKPAPAFRKLHLRLQRPAAEAGELLLGHVGYRAERAGFVDQHQRPPGLGHLARLGEALGHDPGEGRGDRRKTARGIRLGTPGLRRRMLGFGRIEGRLGLVEGGHTDEVARAKAASALEGSTGIHQPRLGRRDVGRCCSHGLVGLAGVDAHQHVALAHPRAGIRPRLQHPPLYLGRDGGLAHGLDGGLAGMAARPQLGLDLDGGNGRIPVCRKERGRQ